MSTTPSATLSPTPPAPPAPNPVNAPLPTFPATFTGMGQAFDQLLGLLQTLLNNIGEWEGNDYAFSQQVVTWMNNTGTSYASIVAGLNALQTSIAATYATQAQLAALQATVTSMQTTLTQIESALTTEGSSFQTQLTTMQAQIATINTKLGIT